MVNNATLKAELDRRIIRPSMNNDANSVAQRDGGGKLNVATGEGGNHAVNNFRLQNVIRQRPAFYTGSGPVPANLPGAVAGDVWFDHLNNKLYRITGV